MVKVKKITQTILNTVIQKRPADSFKGTYGKIALIGGSQNFGGAIIMASLAAVYSGAGLVTTITDPTNQTSLHDWLPEAMFVDWNQFEQAAPIIQAANVVVIGPGLGTDNQAFDLLTKTFQLAKPGQIFVIDGSALTLLAANKLALPQDSINVLTPHQMEWQRVSGIQMADQTPQENQAAAQKLNAIVVVKSHRTQVYANDQIYENTGGTRLRQLVAWAIRLPEWLADLLPNSKIRQKLSWPPFIVTARSPINWPKSSMSFYPIKLVRHCQNLCIKTKQINDDKPKRTDKTKRFVPPSFSSNRYLPPLNFNLITTS